METKGKATITIDQRQISVEFEGQWTRRMIEAAYTNMIKNLKPYILQQTKAQSEKPKKKGIEK